MKSSDFYLGEFLDNKIDKYEAKFQNGKPYIDSRIEDFLFEKLFLDKDLQSNTKLLEIGFFSGRITRKLKKYFSNIYMTEHSIEMIKGIKNAFLFDWVNNKIDKKLLISKPFDLIISIGHPLSFSCNINKGIASCSKLIRKNGLFIFDIWNANSSEEILPNYLIERMDKKKIEVILNKNGFEMIDMYYGQSFFSLFPRLLIKLYSKKIFSYIFFPIILKLEKILLLKKIVIGNPQTIFFIAKKN